MAWDKTKLRREMAARLACMMIYTDAEIAAAIGVTVGGLQAMKQTPDYQAILFQIKAGVISEADEVLGDNIEEMRQRVKDLMPAALSALADAVMQRRDLKLSKDAALDLIKIDGRMAPVTRTGAALPEQGGTGKIFEFDDKMADALTVALAARKAKEVTIDSAPATEKTQ